MSVIPLLMDSPEQQSGIRIGYARVSTTEQNLDLQINALREAGVSDEYIFSEHVSGVKAKRPEFQNCLKFLRRGDTLVVWKIDRLSRSFKELFTIADMLQEREMIRERTIAGLAAAALKGRKGGAPKKIKPRTVKKAIEMKAQGVVHWKVCETLNVKPSTLSREIKLYHEDQTEKAAKKAAKDLREEMRNAA